MPPPVRTSFLFIVAAGAAVLAILALVSIPLLALAQDVAGTLNAIDTPEDAVKTVVRVIGTWKTVTFMGVLVALSQVGLWALRKIPAVRTALEKRGLLTVVSGLCGAIGAAGLAWIADQKERIPEAIASGFVPKSFKGVLDPVVKSLSAYNLILKDTALTQGDYKRTADSTANVLRTIKAQVTDLAGAFGKGLEPVLNRVGISLRDKFADPQTKQRVEELGKLVGEKLQNALRKIGDWFRQHWGGIKEGFRTTGRVLRDLAKAAEGFYAVLKKIGSITPGGTSTVIGLIVGGILFSKIMTAANAVTVLNTRLGRLAAMRIVIPIVFATSIYGPMKGWFEKNLGANFSGTQAAGDLIPVKKDGRWVDPNTGRAVRNQRYWDERERRIRSGIGATGPIDGRPGTGLAGERVTSPGGGLKPITSGSFLQAGDAKKKKKKGVQELLPINLRLGLARAELTKQIQDDIRANVEIEKWLEQRVRIERKKERQLDLLEELANTRGRLAALREKDERTRISTLFGGPFLSGDAFSTAASFGYTAKPRDLLKDLRMGNAQLAILARSLRRLQRRGAPKALVEEIRGMGLEGSDEAAALAGASKSTFRQYVRAFKNRERLEERIQHMEVHDMRVATINAGSIVNNARHHGSQPDDTHRRTSTRASRRRGGRI